MLGTYCGGQGGFPTSQYNYLFVLQIRDGHSENATLLGTYCGGQDGFPTPCITSQYNYLWLKFKTDSSVQNKGFYANYSSINVREYETFIGNSRCDTDQHEVTDQPNEL